MTLPNPMYNDPSAISAALPTPFGLVAQDVAHLTDAMRRAWARIRLADSPFPLIPKTIHDERAIAILYRLGLLSSSGLTDDGVVAFMMGGVPTLVQSPAASPGPGGYWMDAIIADRSALPLASLEPQRYRLALADALQAWATGRASIHYPRRWWRAARRFIASGGVVPQPRAQTIQLLWPSCAMTLDRAVLVVGPPLGRVGDAGSARPSTAV